MATKSAAHVLCSSFLLYYHSIFVDRFEVVTNGKCSSENIKTNKRRTEEDRAQPAYHITCLYIPIDGRGKSK